MIYLYCIVFRIKIFIYVFFQEHDIETEEIEFPSRKTEEKKTDSEAN